MFSTKLKKSLAFLLSTVMVLSVVPVYSFASENTGDDQIALVDESDYGVSAAALTDTKIGVSKKNTSGKFTVIESGASITAKAEYNGVRAKGTLVITNNHATAVVLSFGYTLSGSGASASGLNGSSGFYQKKLNKNESLEIAITTGGFFDNATLYLTNVTAKEIVAGTANINFVYNPAYGSVSGSGTAGQNVTVKATAAAGSKFLGWTDTSGLVLSKNASFSFLASGNDTIMALFSNPNGEAYFEAGNYISADINKAAAGGSLMVLVADGVLGAGNYTVPAGVTLLIPKDTANTVNTTEPDKYAKDHKDGYKLPHITPTAFRTLKMANGANITVNGAISVAGSQYAGGTGDIMGGVYGPVGFIRMENGSKITVNNGANLYAWGYIIGSGEIEVLKGGTVYESFQSTDWRGGSATSALAMDDKNNVFPMTQYYVQNVEVSMKLNAGSFEKGYSCTTVSPVALVGVKGAEVPFIGTGDTNLFTIDSGYIIKDYDEATDRQVYNVYGNLSMKKIRVSMEAGLLGTTITLDSSKYVLPITNNLTIDVHSGTINITQDVCFLPGAEIIIRDGAVGNLTNGKSVFVYDLSEWGGYVSSYNAQYIPLSFAPGRTGNRAPLADAKIQIDGTVNASAGFLYTTKSGAVVTSSGTGRVIMKSGTATNTYQITQNNTDTTNVAIPVVVAKLQNADGTTTNPAKEINPSAGTIYTYTDGNWVAKCRNSTCVADGQVSCSNPLPCKYCAQQIKPGHKYASSVTTPATCVAEGVLTYTCSACADSYTEAIPATGVHTYTSAVTTPAACTTEGVRTYTCSVCSDSYTEAISATGHTAVVDKAVAATCTEEGKTEGSHCSVCNAVIKAQETVPATGHTTVVDKAVAATCTADGKTEGSHCSVCNAVVKAQETVPATGHTAVVDKAVASTCTTDGKTEGSHCSVCNTVIKAQEIVKAPGHKSVTDKAIAATCTASGKTEGAHCSVCNTVIKAQETVPATGHSLVWTETKQATAFAEGESTGKCQNCTYSEKKVIAKLLKVDVVPGTKENIKLAESGNMISFEQVTVSNLTKNITANAEILTKDGNKAAENAVVTTGMKIVLKDASGKVADEKTIVVPGDVDCDGKIAAADARAALRRSVGLDEFKDYQTSAADVDRSEKITASDARAILRASVGLVDKKDFYNNAK